MGANIFKILEKFKMKNNKTKINHSSCQPNGMTKKVIAFSSSIAHKRIAFSLIELMISLIAISLITAAFSPAITKKLASSEFAVGASSSSAGEVSDQCADIINEKCTWCYPKIKKCISCTETCNSDTQYLNYDECTCHSCSDIEHCVGTCEYKDGAPRCKKCDDNYYISDGKCVECPSGSICDGINEITLISPALKIRCRVRLHTADFRENILVARCSNE